MAHGTLRIATLNTWKNEGDYSARLDAMTTGLRALSADVILLQEVFRTLDDRVDTGRALAEALGFELAYAPARRKSRLWRGELTPSEAGLAVLVRGRVVRSARLELPSDVEGGERIALLVEARVAEKLCRVACVHLSHLRGDEARRVEQLAAVLSHAWWREPAAISVLGGDFNTAPGACMRAATATVAGSLAQNVFIEDLASRVTHPLPPRPGRLGREIDALFTLGPAPCVLQATVELDAPVDSVWPSDHAAVLAELALDSP